MHVTIPAGLLVTAVVAVGVLHTLVPDHWLPIALLARQYGWTRRQVLRTAIGAGIGHALSTIALGLVLWGIGEIAEHRFAHAVSIASSLALVAFGAWVMVASMRELRVSAEKVGHAHLHRHADGVEHQHWHEHEPGHEQEHAHEHNVSRRMAVMLLLGSSPMVEGVPAFFAAARYGAGLLAVMTILFTLSTVATYAVLCVGSSAGTVRISLGPVERYGEVLSGALIASLGIVFLVF